MSPARWRVARVLAGVAVLAVVLATVGVGAAVDGLRALDPLTVLAATALAVPATVACAWRWRLVGRRSGADIGLLPAVAACYRAQLLNSTLPGGVAGDVHRGVVHGRSTGNTVRGLRAVVVERLAGQLVLAAVAVPVVLLVPSPVRPPLGGVAAGFAGVAAVLGLAAAIRFLVGPVWPGVVVASVMALACNLATYLLAARAVGTGASTTTLLPLVLLVFVGAALPLNVAGWGPREGVATWAFAVAGLGAAQGLATAVAFGAVVLVANLPGALVLLARGRTGVPSATSPVAGPERGAAHV